ncbi:MFS transporter [Streptomyces radicis]|uniref:MFS transporter n=1 Tax=Streptomyces radicis TaxID=1750517 RepID=A0A3A9WJH8_9ACTN|nr:MFS transporter [Streptomyces radicis]RKN12762.1 MFS transporter [Streptomyces radicis]RKN27474.1 MFS transporter [Streptomyces radicis]
MATGYLELLRSRHVLRLLTGTLVGRLPHGTAALAIVLFARAEGGGYTLAGLLSGLHGLATAIGQPLLGRLVDVYGQPRVMVPAALVSAAAMGLLAAVGIEPLPLACAAILVAGLTTPPLEGGLRALWSSVLGDSERVHRAYALDAVAQELIFAGGPLAVMLLVAMWSEGAALLVINAVGVLGALSVLLSGPSRRWRGAAREAHWLGALRSRGLLALLGCFFFVGGALGAISVAAVAYADARGDELVATYLLSALGGGALIGGLCYGARHWPGVPERRLALLVTALALGYLPLALVPASVPVMTLLLGVAGIFLAPALACAFVVIDRHAPTGTVTEAFSWMVTTFGVGAAVGTAVVGPAIEWGEDAAGFAVAGGSGLLALAVLAATRRVLAAPGGVPGPVAGSQNDRNAVLEPGFRSGHRA